MIRAWSTRDRDGLVLPTLFAIAAVMAVTAGSCLAASLAIEGHVAAYRPAAGVVCPSAARSPQP